MSTGEIIGRIAKRYPEARTECNAVAVRLLEKFETNSLELNGILVSDLLDMQAVEAALTETIALMEQINEALDEHGGMTN